MSKLDEFRAQHPDYDDMDDKSLADALHSKFYADMPQDQFYERMGLRTSGGAGQALFGIEGGTRAVTRGLTGGLSDYVEAAYRYGLDKVRHPKETYDAVKSAVTGESTRSLSDLIADAPDRKLTSYNDALKEQRGAVEEFRESNPVAAYSSEIGGGVVSPVFKNTAGVVDEGLNALTRFSPKIAQSLAENGGARFLQYGAQGGGAGVVAGLGNAQGEGGGLPTAADIGKSAAATGAGGVVLGMGIPALAEVGMSAAAKAKPAAQAILDRLPGMQTSASARTLAKAFADDGMTPAQIEQNLKEYGSTGRLVYAGGKNTARLLDTLSTLRGKTAEMADTELNKDLAGQGSRLVGSTKRNISDVDFHQAVDDLSEAQRQTSRPLYEKAFDAEQGQHYGGTVANNAHVERLTANPDVKSGILHGMKIIRNEADADDVQGHFTDTLHRLTSDDLGNFDVLKQKVPTLRLLDAGVRGIDDQLEKYRNPITGKLDLDEYGRSLVKLRSSLDKQLKELTGGEEGFYAQAKAAWAGPQKVKDAMYAGRRFARGDEELAVKTFQSMQPSLQDAYRDGVAREIIGQIRKKGSTPAVLKNVLNDTDTQARIKTIAPTPEKYQAFIDDIEREVNISSVATRVLKGSQTAERTAGQSNLGMDMGGVVADIAMGHPVQATTGIIRSVMAALKNPQLPQKSRDQLGEWLVSNNPETQKQALQAIQSKARLFGVPPQRAAQLPGLAARSTGPVMSPFMTGGSNQ